MDFEEARNKLQMIEENAQSDALDSWRKMMFSRLLLMRWDDFFSQCKRLNMDGKTSDGNKEKKIFAYLVYKYLSYGKRMSG